MNQPSSSISSSRDPATPRRGLAVLLWTLVGLAAIDILVNFLFAYPDDPKASSATSAQLYFDYGRSIEGKLARITRADRDETAPITLAGWYEPLVAQQDRRDDRQTVSFYGMSHAMLLADAMARTSALHSPRKVGAPGATANWAFGAFLRDEERGRSKAAVLAIMSMTVPMITTMSAMTWNDAFPMPYTSDRFIISKDGFQVARPPFESFEDYVAHFEDSEKWISARSRIKAFDPMYDDLLVRRNVFDHSAIARLWRRAYAQRRDRLARERSIGRFGFENGSEEIALAREIVKRFAQVCRREGIIPVIYIVNNFGYSDHLYRALEPTLAGNDIPYVSSHDLVSPSDPRGYLPDTHFSRANDDRLAQAVDRVIEDRAARN